MCGRGVIYTDTTNACDLGRYTDVLKIPEDNPLMTANEPSKITFTQKQILAFNHFITNTICRIRKQQKVVDESFANVIFSCVI